MTSERRIISQIEAARRRNNVHWMSLLRLAMEFAPKQAKAALKKINAEDQRISKLLRKLSK